MLFLFDLFQILILSVTVFFEASGENQQSKIAHAWVVKNRVDHVLFADGYWDVVFQKKHFSCYNSDQLQKHVLRLESKGFRKCFIISYKVYYGIIKDNTKGSLWYTTTYEYKDGKKVKLRRAWMKDLKENCVYDKTTYYGLKDER